MNAPANPTFLKDKVSLFRDFSVNQLQALVHDSKVECFEANEIIMRHGTEATHLGVVLSGTVGVSVPLARGAQQWLGRLEAGDTCNEAALMTGDAVLADFIAESNSAVLLIPVSIFHAVIVAEPGAVRSISRAIAERTKRIMSDPAKAAAVAGQAFVTPALAVQHQQPFPVEISAHHIHLTQDHVEVLMGKGHQLTRHADLSQPGQYACKEQLAIVGPKGRIERVRVLGPVRKYTQVEIAMTEQYKLGLHPPIRESGDILGTPGCTLEGPAGSVKLECGVICALRHIHMTPEDALRYGVHDKAIVRVRVAGDRELVFGDVLVRVDPGFALAMHLDTDEANAANLAAGAQGYLEGIQSEG